MATLESLPHDIRFIILTSLIQTRDWQALYSLISTSRPFFTTFQLHRKHFIHAFLRKEYILETQLILALNRLNALPASQETWALVIKVIYKYTEAGVPESSYMDFQDNVLDEAGYYFNEELTRGDGVDSEGWDPVEIRDIHEAVLIPASRFLEEQRHPCASTSSCTISGVRVHIPRVGLEQQQEQRKTTDGGMWAPSVTEYIRVFKAFYRVWCLVVIYSVKYQHGDAPFGYQLVDTFEYLVGETRESWGFWGAKVVEIIGHYLVWGLDDVIQNAVDTDEGGDSGSGRISKFNVPPVLCGCTTSPSPRHAHQDFIGNLFRHDFGAVLRAFGNRPVMEQLIQDAINRPPAPPFCSPLDKSFNNGNRPCPGRLTTFLTSISQEYLPHDGKYVALWSSVIARPVFTPIMREERNHRDMKERYDRGLLGSNFKDWISMGVDFVKGSIDLWGVVWDDERLVEWGYWLPEVFDDTSAW
ncbi:hypothetical protein TWF730_001686 [Orbilia blumenaviensis]|uniref:F-box domain-containing protein n=1 Tax=Orbilia blumenaviensis TaxID=1796055 RepID=A0AAV9UIM2_9PEZI